MTARTRECIAKPPRPEFENVDATTARAFHAFGRVLHLNRLAMMRMFAQRGIQHAEAHALPLLCSHEGINQRELGERLHLSPPRVSTLVRSLEKNGTVERRTDEADRRLTRVFITDKGRRLEKEQHTILEDFVNGTIGVLPEADKLELERLLDQLAESIERALSVEAADAAHAKGAER